MKRLLKISGITLASLLLITAGLFWYISKRITPILKAQINQQLAVTLEVSEIKITKLSAFPNIGITFNNISIHESQNFYNKPMLQAKELSLYLDIMKMIRKDYVIDAISLKDGSINLVQFADGSNFDILKPDTSNSSDNLDFNIEDLKLANCKINYQHTPTKFISSGYTEKMAAKIGYKDKATKLNLKGNLLVDSIMHSADAYLRNQQTAINTDITLTDDYSFVSIAPSNLQVEKVDLVISGNILMKELTSIDMKFNNKEANINDIISILPDYLQSSMSHLKLDGNANINGYFKGKIDDTHSPGFGFTYTLKEASLSPKDQNLSIDNISANGEMKITDLGNLNNAWASCKLSKASSGDNSFNGDLFVENFNIPLIKWDGNTSFNAKTIVGLLDQDNFNVSSGRIATKGKFELRYDVEKELVIPKSFKYLGSVKGQKIVAQLLDPNINIKDLEFDLDANSSKMVVRECKVKYNNSAAQLAGYILNLDEAFDKNSRTEIVGKLDLDNFIVTEFLSSDTSSNDAKVNKTLFPFLLTLNTSVKDFTYNDFHAEKLAGTLKSNKKALLMDDAALTALEGNANANIRFTTLGDYYLLDLNSKVRSINITTLFKQFNNFEQTEITEEHLSGSLTGDIMAKVMFDANFNPLLDKLYAKADIEIVDGELNGYEPLKELSSFVEVKDLENVKFSSLKNTIEIFDQTIFIPKMHIGNSAMNIDLEGTHTFENYMNYNMSISLLELMAGKSNWLSKKKEKRIEDNEYGGLTAYITMTGTPDNLIIKYDKVTVNKVVKEEINNEKKNFINALKGEATKEEKSAAYYDDIWDE